MVAASECSAKAQLNNARRVSKPMMEKKRRARINECLDELKTLMENYYTNYIRKRKLEKADILEMTVRHLRNLQKAQQGSCVEYHAGFQSCLNGVNQFFLAADHPHFLRLNVLKHLSGQLCGSAAGSSTADSDASGRVAMSQSVRLSREEAEKKCRLPPPRRITDGDQQQPNEMSAGNENETRALPRVAKERKQCACVSSHSYWRPWQKM
uniref:Transcription factor HES-3-like n=1 Tax=Scleropages formosus TaxID=113540 RepID=A0A8C9RE94_SCLFO